MNPPRPIATGVELRPDSSRTLLRAFIPADRSSILRIIERALAPAEEEISRRLELLDTQFGERHPHHREAWLSHYAKVARHVPDQSSVSHPRQLYIGTLFSGEYSIEAAALFNPSIVPHPDQSGLGAEELRFVLSLRATGEGHVSSITFRSGIVRADHSIEIDEPGRHVTAPALNPDPTFPRTSFFRKLHDMGYDNEWSRRLMQSLGDRFSRSELNDAVRTAGGCTRPFAAGARRTAECIRWLADVNYEVHFDPATPLGERAIFPISPTERNGMEDARFVRFVEPDGGVAYYATYTAYDGRSILPQLIETRDFLNFRAVTLNGAGVRNKGMALFPRRIDGRYAMLSRQDDENLYLMFSDDPHAWEDARILRRPAEAWEAVKIGNCGSPIETAAGWLVLTHGVGPMRRYCIGAMLLDLDDPAVVLGHLTSPLIEPDEPLRNGYVPNVVYTCGAIVERGRLILPYGLSDTFTTIATVDLEQLLAALGARQG